MSNEIKKPKPGGSKRGRKKNAEQINELSWALIQFKDCEAMIEEKYGKQTSPIVQSWIFEKMNKLYRERDELEGR